MTVAIVDVTALKAIKNSVIGNRTAKAALGQDEVYVAKCVFLVAVL